MSYIEKGLGIIVIPETKTSKAISVIEYKEIMTEIWNNHRFGGLSDTEKNKRSRFIKYVRPQWDMRSGTCFNITFDDITFDFRGTEESMHSRIMRWLNGEDDVIFGGLPWQNNSN